MLKAIRWKIHVHTVLRKNGTYRNIVRDILSIKYRRATNDIYKNIGFRVADSLGLKFSTGTPSESLLEVFAEKMYDIPDCIPAEGQLVLDAGAYYGDTSIFWSKLHNAKVIAFEPLEDVFKILSENISLNEADVVAYNKALGDGGGHLREQTRHYAICRKRNFIQKCKN